MHDVDSVVRVHEICEVPETLHFFEKKKKRDLDSGQIFYFQCVVIVQLRFVFDFGFGGTYNSFYFFNTIILIMPFQIHQIHHKCRNKNHQSQK